MRISPRIEARLAALESRPAAIPSSIDEAVARQSWELLQDVLEGLYGKRERMPADWLTRPRVPLSQEARDQAAEIYAALNSPLGKSK